MLFCKLAAFWESELILEAAQLPAKLWMQPSICEPGGELGMIHGTVQRQAEMPPSAVHPSQSSNDVINH